MYVVSLDYFRPMEEVEALLAAHIAWLDRYFDAGAVIAAGRKDPQTGGLLLVKEMPHEQLDALLAEDPFVAVAHYTVTRVNVTQAAEEFAGLKGQTTDFPGGVTAEKPHTARYPSCRPHSRLRPKKRVSSSAIPGSHLRVVWVSPTDR
ncbi:hypothetical protein FD733_10205 [Pantoea sp. Eser]|nr:hypothetical protein [Pantoea sp. Eser]